MFRLISLSAIVGLSLSLTAHAAPVQYKLDTTKSVIHWAAAKKIGAHNGTVKLKNGEVAIDNGAPKSGNFTIDFATIEDLDLKNDADSKNKLETHLKSADFFNVPSHPTGTFTVKTVTATKVATVYTVVGDLNVKGHTKEISFPATVVVAGNTATAKGEFKINRLDYDLKYNSAKFFDIKKLGDKLILDDIALTLDLVAVADTATVAKTPAKAVKGVKAEAAKALKKTEQKK